MAATIGFSNQILFRPTLSKMTENIELNSFPTRFSNDCDIQEYHEINLNAANQSIGSQSSQILEIPVNEYEFFIQRDAKTQRKKGGKKKKSKHKAKSSNLIDIITSELAASIAPINENVITKVDFNVAQYNSYLVNIPKTNVLFQNRHADSERGCAQRSLIAFSPIFPNILENAVTDSYAAPVEYVDPYIFSNLIDENTNQGQQLIKFLDITLKNIKFKHHHQFSLEKLLCVKLVECYDVYLHTKISLKELARDIKVNRDTKNNLKRDFTKISPNKKEDIRFDKTVLKYTGKMLELKEQQHNILKKQKDIIHNIKSLWSDIEMIREKYDVRDTPYVLQINETKIDQDQFEMEWSDLFNTEFTDLLDQIEYDYVYKYVEYKEIKHNQTHENSTKKKINKPKLKIDEDAVKEQAEKIVNNLIERRTVDLILYKDHNLVSDSAKVIINKYQYYFEIYVDNVFVCESDRYSNTDEMLNIEFFEHFSIQILPNNNNLSIILTENSENVSYIEVSLSEIRKSKTKHNFVTQHFVYNNKIEPNSKYIGSGHHVKEIASANKVRLKSSYIFKDSLFTTCEVDINLEWNNKLNENQSETVRSIMKTGRQIKRIVHGIDKPTPDKLCDIIGQIYEKDICDDDNMLNTLRKACKTEIRRNDTFPIDENSPEFVRLKLLHLRNSGRFTRVPNKMIPLHGSQICTEQLNCLQKSDGNKFDVEYFTNEQTEMDPIELQRFIGAKYIERLNKNMLKDLNEHLRKKSHKDVVKEFKDLSLRGLMSKQSNLATQMSISSATKQQLLKESLSKEQEIQVTVVRAFNLLDRSSAILEAEDEDVRIAGFKVRPLRPFVTVSYHGVTEKSVTGIGCHPSWNHTLKLNTKLDPLSSMYINVYDEYKANVTEGYSEEDQSSSKTVHYRYYHKWLGTLQVPLQTVLNLGVLRGNFKIVIPPVIFGYETVETKESTSLIPEINRLMKKDTSFIALNITTSLSHLGGLQEYNLPVPSISEDDYLIKYLNNFVTEYTNDFPSRNISLTFIDSGGRNKCVVEFLQPIPLPNWDCFPKNPKSCESAVSKSSGFSRSSSSKSSAHKKEIDVEKASQTAERESVYSGLEGSWKSGDNLTKVVNTCMRYVALIPTYEVTDSHAVTLMGLELLKTVHGSPLDHSILLASYFLHLDIKCWIVIGFGLPRGLSSYVLIKYDIKTSRMMKTDDRLLKKGFLTRSDGYVSYVCDGVRGEKYELRDVGCPLKTIDYVFDNENIWVNIQSSQDCESVSLDFTRSSDWQPVFDKSIFVSGPADMTDTRVYSGPASVYGLRDMLETKIKAKVQKWRPHMKTIWNRYCSGLLKDMLPHWEYWAFNTSDNKPELSQKLKQLVVTYKIFGFPLNMPFASAKSVTSRVKWTSVHVCDDPDAEFALAVEVYAYPNNVISVWVFFASLVTNK